MVRNNLSLIICFFSCFLVVLKIYTGSNIFLLVFLLVISSAILIDKLENKFKYLLFFLPWVYTLKFQFDQFSFFLFLSVVYVFACLLYFIMSDKKIQFNYIFSYFLFISFVISASLLQGGTLTLVLGFILNFTVVFLAALFVKDSKQFGEYTIIYALGLLAGSVFRLITYAVPAMDQYFLSMATQYTLLVKGNLNVRFAGVDLDPNYFSMHILIAVSCLLVNLYYNPDKKILSIFLIVTLSLFGLLSLSKMYLISMLFLIGLTIMTLLKNNLVFGLKFVFSLLFIGVIVVFFSFDYFYESFAERLNLGDKNLDSLTTERNIAWELYINKILQNFNILIFGAGYGAETLSNRMPHNMYLMAFYKFGLMGVFFIIFYIYNLKEIFLKNTNQRNVFNVLSVSSIPLVVLLFSNLALDSIVMDFFPIHLFLVIFSLTYAKKRNRVAVG